jgi:hypothetical protein
MLLTLTTTNCTSAYNWVLSRAHNHYHTGATKFAVGRSVASSIVHTDRITTKQSTACASG